MPGHMGHVRCTTQNLEVVFIDAEKDIMVVKGAVPGPNKGYLVIKEAIKKSPKINPTKLVDIEEAMKKNELIEEAKKYGADINTSMSLKDMNTAVEAAKLAEEALDKAKKEKQEADDAIKAAAVLKEKAEKAAIKVESASNEEEKLIAVKKAKQFAEEAEIAQTKAIKEKSESDIAKQDAITKQKDAEKLQVKTEEVKENDSKATKKDGSDLNDKK